MGNGYRQASKIAREHGYRPVRQSGSHEVWECDGKRPVQLPRHNGDYGKGLFHKIVKIVTVAGVLAVAWPQAAHWLAALWR